MMQQWRDANVQMEKAMKVTVDHRAVEADIRYCESVSPSSVPLVAEMFRNIIDHPALFEATADTRQTMLAFLKRHVLTQRQRRPDEDIASDRVTLASAGLASGPAGAACRR